MISFLKVLQSKIFAAVTCKVASAILTFLFTWSIAQLLTTADAGVFLYTYTVMMVLVQLSRAGTEHSMIKALSINESSQYGLNIVKKIGLYVVLVSLCFSTLLLVIIEFEFIEIYLERENYMVLLCFLAVAICFAISQVIGTFFQSNSKVYKQYWAMAIGVSLSGCLVSLIVYYFQFNVTSYSFSLYFLVAVFISLCLCVSILAFDSFMSRSNRSASYTGKDASLSLKGLVKFTLPYSQLAFITIIVQWGAALLSGGWLSEDELAVLSVCLRVGLLTNFFFLAFNALLAPRFAKLHNENRVNEIEDSSLLEVFLATVFSLFVFCIFVLFGKDILGAFGESYIDGYMLLLAISFAWLVRVFIGPVDIILLMTNKVKISRKNLIISSIFTLSLSLLLIPNFGLVGAAISAALSGASLSILNFISVRRLYGINYCSFSSLLKQIRVAKTLVVQ